MSRLAALIAAALAALLLASCAGSSDDGDTGQIQALAGLNCGDVQYSGSGQAQKLIVSDLPLQGASMQRSKQMNDAIVQEMARRGWQAGQAIQVAFQACDDSISSTGEWDAATCRKNAAAYANNPDVIGVIGTYNSGCAGEELPILNQAAGGGVPMVSPGNTYVCLTETSSLCAKDEPGKYYPHGKRNYVRVVPNDAVQGAGLATFADEQGIKKPYVLYAAKDPTSTGQAQNFSGAARSLGMQVAGTSTWDPEAKSFSDVMGKVKKTNPDAVVLAGLLEQEGAQLIKDKVAALGPNDGKVRLFAMDGFAQQATIDDTGGEAAGMFVSLPGKTPSSLTGTGDVFVKQLQAQIGDQPVEVFAPYAGQAAEVLLSAIQTGKDRAGTISSLFKLRVNRGIVGQFSFSPTGDPTPSPISVQKAGSRFELQQTIAPLPQLVTAARGG